MWQFKIKESRYDNVEASIFNGEKYSSTFESKKTGCTAHKTPEQKFEFYESLKSFVFKDEQFFDEQFNDLKPHEKLEFAKHIIKVKN